LRIKHLLLQKEEIERQFFLLYERKVSIRQSSYAKSYHKVSSGASFVINCGLEKGPRNAANATEYSRTIILSDSLRTFPHGQRAADLPPKGMRASVPSAGKGQNTATHSVVNRPANGIIAGPGTWEYRQ